MRASSRVERKAFGTYIASWVIILRSIAIPAITIPPAVTIPRMANPPVVAVLGESIPAVFVQIAPEFSMILANFCPALPDLANALPHLGSALRDLLRIGAPANVPTEFRFVPMQLSYISAQFRSILE